MQYETAVNVLESLANSNTDVEQLFKAYLTIDVHKIKKRSEKCLDELDFRLVDDYDREDFFHHASMAVFNYSVIDYYTEKGWPIEDFVEHDIPSWIESHAEILAESILAALDVQVDNVSAFATLQNDALQNLWIEIEKRLHLFNA